MDRIVKSALRTPTDTGAAMLVMDIFGVDRRAVLAKLNKPSLMIASSLSPLLDAQKEMATTIPGAKFVSMDGAGHAVFIDEPGKFVTTDATLIVASARHGCAGGVRLFTPLRQLPSCSCAAEGL